MNLCKYKNIFGAPNTGLHAYRLFDVAIVDVLMTFFFAYLISKWLKFPYVNTCLVLFILAIVLHKLFCVDTTVNKFIFGNS